MSLSSIIDSWINYAGENDIESLKEYRNAITDPNVESSMGTTALVWACTNSALDSVKYLVQELKADPNRRDSDGNTPLAMATLSNSLECVEILLGAENIDVNATDSEGSTALHDACSEGNASIVKALLDHGIDKEVVNKYGKKARECCMDSKTLQTLALHNEPQINFKTLQALSNESRSSKESKSSSESEQKRIESTSSDDVATPLQTIPVKNTSSRKATPELRKTLLDDGITRRKSLPAVRPVFKSDFTFPKEDDVQIHSEKLNAVLDKVEFLTASMAELKKENDTIRKEIELMKLQQKYKQAEEKLNHLTQAFQEIKEENKSLKAELASFKDKDQAAI